MGILEFAAIAAMCAPGVHTTTLEAIVTHESRANIYAIGVNGDYKLPKQPSNFEEAVSTAKWLHSEGYNFDAGLAQINIKNFEWLGLSIEDSFDSCKNLAAAEKVLTTCYERAVKEFEEGQPALQAALSCYNTGNFEKGFANGYVYKVASNVGIPVPALEPIYVTGKKEAIKIQSNDVAKPKSVTTTNKVNTNLTSSQNTPKKPSVKKEGMNDAFGSVVSDAFSSGI